MPVKILLADRSITIQKVVEMLFSGREYEVVCASDGETAANEAARVVPDVVLADVDLPRMDGYAFAARLRQTPQLAQTPVILMMSRDDVYDSVKGKHAGIVDNIAKPFESQELIGKVKKALAAASPRTVAPAQPPQQPIVSAPQPAKMKPTIPVPAGPKPSTPPDIFDIIQEAPSESELKKVATPAAHEEESVYEVEPEVEEIVEPVSREIAKALPLGEKAVEEMRSGLGLADQKEETVPEMIPFESLDLSFEAELQAEQITPPKSAAIRPETPPAAPPLRPSTLPESELRKMAEEAMAKMAKEVFEKIPVPQPPAIPLSEIRSMAERTISGMAQDVFAKMPPIKEPTLTESELRKMAEEAMAKTAKEAFEKTPQPQISDETIKKIVEEKAAKIASEAMARFSPPEPPTLPPDEIRSMAEAAVSRMAADVFKHMAPPPPKISEDTIRRGLEEVLTKIAREMAKDVIERVAWEVVPELAEHLIKEEIERLKAME